MRPAPVQFTIPGVSLHACPAPIAPAERWDIDHLTASDYLDKVVGGGDCITGGRAWYSSGSCKKVALMQHELSSQVLIRTCYE